MTVCMLGTILLVVMVPMLIGALPRWGHGATCGYGPSGGLVLVLVILLILVLTGRMLTPHAALRGGAPNCHRRSCR